MLCAIAGAATVEAAATLAAPTPAVLMNFLRCIFSSPPRLSGSLKGSPFFERTETDMCNLLWEAPVQNAKNPAYAGFFDIFADGPSEFAGGRLTGHEVVEGVFDHAEPQHFL